MDFLKAQKTCFCKLENLQDHGLIFFCELKKTSKAWIPFFFATLKSSKNKLFHFFCFVFCELKNFLKRVWISFFASFKFQKAVKARFNLLQPGSILFKGKKSRKACI